MSSGGADFTGVFAWAEEALGGPVSDWERLGDGNSRVTWAARIAGTPVIVRHDDGRGPVGGSELSLRREAVVYRAVAGLDPRIPRLLAASERTIVINRFPGRPEWDQAVQDELLDVLAALPRPDPAGLALAGLPGSARADLDLWARVAERTVRVADPWLATAFSLLGSLYPGEPDRLVLCHGDAGAGNVLADGGRLSGVLDWEFAHLGDPMDDLAWITVRAVLTRTPLSCFGASARRYAALAGVELDEERLRYWQAVVLLRNLVCCQGAISASVPGSASGAPGRCLVHHTLVPALHAQLVRALAGLMKVSLSPSPSLASRPVAELPGGLALAEAARELSDLTGQLTDPAQRRQAKLVRLVLGQLADTWPLAPVMTERGLGGELSSSPAQRLQELADWAAWELQLLPRSQAMADAPLAGFD